MIKQEFGVESKRIMNLRLQNWRSMIFKFSIESLFRVPLLSNDRVS